MPAASSPISTQTLAGLAAYVQGHASSRPPLAAQPLSGRIACAKTGALYGMHAYWSKKPHDAIRAFIRHHTRPGDLILDPFSGSGGTAAVAYQEGRAALGFDRSPAAVFIARHYTSLADASQVQAALEEVLHQARRRTDKAVAAAGSSGLYATLCDRCGARAELMTTLYDHGEPRRQPQPIALSYRCPSCGKGKREANEQDHADLAAIASTALPAGVPRDRMMHREGVWGDSWRNGTSSFETVDALFTPRNLRAMASLQAAIAKVKDAATREVLLFAFSGHLFAATTMQQDRPSGGGFAKGTYYVPRRFVERQVFDGFARRVRAVLAGKAQLAHVPAGAQDAPRTERIAPCIRQGDARRLPLPEACIDYIFTDPPYLDAVQYAELNFLWESWLGFDTSWHDDEIVVNRTRHLTREHWQAGMRQALNEMVRVLKPGGWLSLCFAAPRPAAWRDLGLLLAEAGLEPGGTAILEPAQQSYNRLKPTKKARHDRVISWRKPLDQATPFAVEAWLAALE